MRRVLGDGQQRRGVGGELRAPQRAQRRGDPPAGVRHREADRHRPEVEAHQRAAGRQRRGEVRRIVMERSAHSATPASFAVARSSASASGSAAKVSRASRKIASASSVRPSTPSERISCAQSSGGPPSAARRSDSCRDHARDHRGAVGLGHRRGGRHVAARGRDRGGLSGEHRHLVDLRSRSSRPRAHPAALRRAAVSRAGRRGRAGRSGSARGRNSSARPGSPARPPAHCDSAASASGET